MRAVVNTSSGGPEVLDIQNRPTPEPGIGQVRVRIVASALNRADISQRLGRYPAPPGSPADIPGLEYAGEVDALGAGANMWKVGDRVMGICGGGAHAEFLCVHEREAIPAPSMLSVEACGAIPEVFLTAYDALFLQLHLTAGETLLIHAAGSGVGTAAIQLAHNAGARTIGTSRSPAKLDRCLAFGLDAGFHVRDDTWSSRLIEETGGTPVNAILDLVGASYLKGNLEILAPRGRMISVGLTAGSRAELDMGALMRKRLSLVGTVLRSRPIEEKIHLARMFADLVVPMFQAGRLEPVIDRTVEFSRVREAHAAMEANETFGKIVLVWR